MRNPEYSMAGLLAYVARFDLPFLRAAEGEPEEAIHPYELAAIDVTGLEFPPDYREFLRLMGKRTPMDFAGEADMSLASLWSHYEELLGDIRRGDEELPPERLVIACGGGWDMSRLALECLENADGTTRSGRVFAWGDYEESPQSDTLLGYLFCQAFSSCANRHLPLTATFTGAEPTPALPIIEARVRGLGWEVHEFSDSLNLCASSPADDFSLLARQGVRRGAWLRISGRKAGRINAGRLIKEVAQPICQSTDLRLERWWDT